jgi:general secretion pathway protein E
VSVIITNALEMRASDIHVEPFENRLAVRYRVDGVLHRCIDRRPSDSPRP